MKTFNNIGEMRPYYNEETNTYEFYENGGFLDIEIKFSLFTTANLKAGNIKATSIIVGDIRAEEIKALEIAAKNINAHDIRAYDINAHDIRAFNIDVHDIRAHDIKAYDIIAKEIKAKNIEFYAVCCAYYSFECKSIVSRRPNARYFCLDSEVKVG